MFVFSLLFVAKDVVVKHYIICFLKQGLLTPYRIHFSFILTHMQLGGNTRLLTYKQAIRGRRRREQQMGEAKRGAKA